MDQDKVEKESREAELKEENTQSDGESIEKEKNADKETKTVGPGE